jgi:RNA polymerase sigma-70 factor (ECF subfamily)
MDEQEKALVERVLSGDNAAFEYLILPYRDFLLGMAFRILRDREDAKETVQETLMRTFKYLKRFDVDRSFKNWIAQILIHAARDFQTKRPAPGFFGQPDPLSTFPAGPADDPEVRQQGVELRSRLMDCLDVLSAREREVFLLRDIEGLSIKESADVLKCSSISVRVHLSGARRKIRDRLKEKYPALLEDI